MRSLRRGFSEIWSDDLDALVRHLRIGMIEDFDADVAPALAERLLRAAPNCDLSLLSRPTHDILDLLQTEQIDIGVATSTDFDRQGLVETPILRDPSVLVVPAESGFAPAQPSDLIAPGATLPFLRYSGRQLLGRRIEMQLRRMGLHFERRMEFETTQVILSLVAESHGWTVTTALSFARAQRTHARLRLLPFPGSAFARRISMFSRTDLPHAVGELALGTIRHAMARMVLEPTCGRYRWLSDQFLLLPETEDDAAQDPAVIRSGNAP
jgi:DNA-binding transcriptional LysR family regulator